MKEVREALGNYPVKQTNKQKWAKRRKKNIRRTMEVGLPGKISGEVKVWGTVIFHMEDGEGQKWVHSVLNNV